MPVEGADSRQPPTTPHLGGTEMQLLFTDASSTRSLLSLPASIPLPPSVFSLFSLSLHTLPLASPLPLPSPPLSLLSPLFLHLSSATATPWCFSSALISTADTVLPSFCKAANYGAERLQRPFNTRCVLCLPACHVHLCVLLHVCHTITMRDCLSCPMLRPHNPRCAYTSALTVA